jgi:hypothetical protein
MILANHGIVSSSGALPSTLLTNLYAVYKAESNANDSLGVYNGTAQGGLTYSSGQSGNAFLGNGTNGYVGLPNNSFNFTNDFSISMWINLTDITGNQDLFCNSDIVGGGVDEGYRLSFRGSTSFIRFSIYGSSIVNLDTTTSSIPLNTWTNIVITRKANTGSKIYLNGNLSTSNTSTVNPIYTGTFAPTIGAYKTTTTPFLSNLLILNSKIDEINIWNKELTSIEVTELQTIYYPY